MKKYNNDELIYLSFKSNIKNNDEQKGLDKLFLMMKFLKTQILFRNKLDR